MTTGTELIRRKLGQEAEAFALTCPLITKADGKKFGKTESGNVWLDRNRTTPYAFYQFWLNVSDDDAERYIKIFTSLDKETIDALVEEHRQDPGRRVLQRRLAEEVTVMVHSREDLDMAIEASNILFGKSTKESLLKLDEQTLLDVFDGVPHFTLPADQLGQPAVEIFTRDDVKVFSMGAYGSEPFGLLHEEDPNYAACLNVDAWVLAQYIFDGAIKYYKGEEIEDKTNIALFMVDSSNVEDFWTFD